MFHDIPEPVLKRMKFLEEADARDRGDGTSLAKRLKQITPEVGRFLALLVASAPPGDCIEVGTSAGYSTLWLAFACRLTGRKLRTLEILPEKAALARETFRIAGLTDFVDFVQGDALQHVPTFKNIGFCFLDADKETYPPCYEAMVPNLVRGGILAADNATSHESALHPMLQRALTDTRVDAVIVPIGRGELVCRKI
ncbi:MAG TPA: O-methyltransferase [Verrucomicrobiae bacterium]|jgi:predicted O-methyltransferase YrrM|nr:O-methyltransferase [Verrucomicrobiae bacterium]